MTGQARELASDEARLVRQIANTSRDYGGEIPAWWLERVSVELALRLAEKAYRRGFQQGADAMREHFGYDDSGPGEDFARAVSDWRARGAAEDYATGELPPDMAAVR